VTLWVFGYGSLMWNPGFAPAERRLAVLPGYARSFCMRSVHHRGTPEAPGLVLALDRAEGAACRGVAFRVAPGAEDAVLAMLRERELVSAAYLEEVHPVLLDAREAVDATAFVIDRAHVQYCRLPLTEQAAIIARATGGRGPNAEYLHNTVAHLAGLGIDEPDLVWLDGAVRRLAHQEVHWNSPD
jgi:cation transport protein ChaC